MRSALGLARARGIGAVVLAACGGPQSGHPPSEPHLLSGRVARVAGPSPDGTPAPRDDGRLPPTATPRRYALSLRIDPRQSRFEGVTTIQIDVPEPTEVLVLHARDMNIARAVAHVAASEVTAAATVRPAHGSPSPDELVLTFSRPLPAGDASIDIHYDAPFAADLSGLYRVSEGGNWYAFSQFEATHARKMFPCFDEPGFKTPYDVTITSPADMRALTNSPETSETPLADGTVLYRFDTSRPLPSYLVAVAVGDFDVVEWQKEPFPLRAVTPKGRANLTGLSLDTAAALVTRLGDYLGYPYPYPKLDLVAVPEFAAGAMENPGLVTFRDTLLLLDSRRATISARRQQAEVIAHELAHQWFGDLVTLQWWDDVWLNEALATWAEAKVVDIWKPSFGATLEQIASAEHVMDIDALKSARAVREPVRSTREAEEAFDSITYDKGAAVLRMIEGWLGPDVFRRGLQRYLQQHAWKNATAADLYQALDFVSAQHVARLAGSFVDQPGVPEVIVGLGCGAAGGRISLRESEWRPLGEARESGRSWTLPVCIGSDTQKSKSCFTLAGDPISRDLGSGACPSWIHPNAEGTGYYRFVLDGPRLVALARSSRSLPPIDRLGILSNAWAEVRQGAVGPAVLFDLLPAFDGDTNRFVLDELAQTMEGIDLSLVDQEVRGPFERYVAARVGARKASLGWEEAHPYGPGKDGDQDDDRMLARRTALWLSGELAHDESTLQEAEGYAERWLRDATSIPADAALVALPLSSMRAGEARLHELRSAAVNAKTPEDRALAIRSMGTFDDPALLRKAFDLVLSDDIKASDVRYLFEAAVGHRAARPVLYAWEKENWAKLNERLPAGFARGLLLDVVAKICTPATRDDARAFFIPRAGAAEGTGRHLDQALEAADLCIALREHGAAETARYLRRR